MSESWKAVFLSYASQDTEVARRLCEALRASDVPFTPASLRLDARFSGVFDAPEIQAMLREVALPKR